MTTCKERLERCLEDADIPHEFQRHRSAFTAQEVAQSEHIPGRMVAKPVMVDADGRLTMVVLPATEQADLGKVTAALHAGTVRLASEDEFRRAFDDCETGAMPVFGNLYGVPVVVDERVAENEDIVTQAGTHAETVQVSYRDFERLVHPLVADVRR
jgi:Ala-tRNA(Pro) deacylase